MNDPAEAPHYPSEIRFGTFPYWKIPCNKAGSQRI
jgi:hypothetical protein